MIAPIVKMSMANTIAMQATKVKCALLLLGAPPLIGLVWMDADFAPTRLQATRGLTGIPALRCVVD